MAVPDGVSVNTDRIWLAAEADKPETMTKMNDELENAIRYLVPAHVEVICMAGTSNSFYQGLGGSSSMEARMSAAAGGLPSVASSPAVVRALNHFGATRVSVVTPYAEWNNLLLRKYLEDSGFEVLSLDSDPRVADGHAQHMNDQDPAEIVEFAAQYCRSDADAIVCACSGWRAMEAAERIEKATGKPCITTNQATIWRTLRVIDIKQARPGFGRLLDSMP